MPFHTDPKMTAFASFNVNPNGSLTEDDRLKRIFSGQTAPDFTVGREQIPEKTIPGTTIPDISGNISFDPTTGQLIKGGDELQDFANIKQLPGAETPEVDGGLFGLKNIQARIDKAAAGFKVEQQPIPEEVPEEVPEEDRGFLGLKGIKRDINARFEAAGFQRVGTAIGDLTEFTTPENVEKAKVAAQIVPDAQTKEQRDSVFDLAGAASSQLEGFITGATPDRFARQARDNFRQFVSAQTDALQADLLNKVQSGQISQQDALAQQNSAFRKFAGIGSQLETTIQQNKETTIKESIKDVSQFLESQVKIDRTTGLIETDEFNRFIKGVTAGVIDPKVARLGISKAFPALLGGEFLNPDGSLKDEFKSPNGFQLMVQELVDAGLSNEEASGLAKIATVSGPLILQALFKRSQIDIFNDGGQTKEAAIKNFQILDPSFTEEDFDKLVVVTEAPKKEAELEANIEAAISDPFGKTADETLADDGVSDEDKAQIIDAQVKIILLGQSLDELSEKAVGDPLFDAVAAKATKVTFESKTIARRGIGFDRQVFTFGPTVGQIINIGGQLYEIITQTTVKKQTGTDTEALGVKNLSTNETGIIKASNPTNIV